MHSPLWQSSYISALQARKAIDAPTSGEHLHGRWPDLYSCPSGGLLNALLSLTDSLTGLERILTTPIPFSYSIHLWVVTTIYCLVLPFQIWKTLGWITIPGTTVVVSNVAHCHHIFNTKLPDSRLSSSSVSWLPVKKSRVSPPRYLLSSDVSHIPSRPLRL